MASLAEMRMSLPSTCIKPVYRRFVPTIYANASCYPSPQLRVWIFPLTQTEGEGEWEDPTWAVWKKPIGGKVVEFVRVPVWH
jgi:hypothetical protein